MTTDFIDGSLFADANNINIDNENRVLGRDSRSARGVGPARASAFGAPARRQARGRPCSTVTHIPFLTNSAFEGKMDE
jgi:hypothetical protein